jgi:hypothetical protein
VTIRLRHSNLRADPDRLNDPTDVIVNLEADVRLEIDGDVIYEELSFPLAELACALARWMPIPLSERPDFEFDSMSSEEIGLLWIRRVDGTWRVGSIHQSRTPLSALTGDDVDDFARAVISELAEEVRTTFGSSAAEYLKQALWAAP